MDGYTFSPYVEARAIGAHEPKDVCGSYSVTYCANAMHLMTVSIAFTHGSHHLVTARLLGGVDYYNVTDPYSNGTLHFEGPEPLLDMDHFDQDGLKEYGLSGMTMDTTSDDIAQYLFVSVNGRFETGGTHSARIYRFLLSSMLAADAVGRGLVASDVTIIYERVDAAIHANAHHLHGGLTFKFDAADGSGPRSGLVISFGDLNDPANTHRTSHDYGKILLMDFNGAAFPTTVFDTGHAHNNMHLAMGNRNAFWMRRLAATCDTSERVVWGENGNSYQRAVLYSLLEPGQAHDLGWIGSDNPGWFRLVDPHKGANAVLFTAIDSAGVVVEPFTLQEPVWQGVGVPAGRGYVLHSYMDASAPGNEPRQRSVTLEVMGNLNSAPQPAGYQVVEVLAQSDANGEYASAPMAMAIHEPTGSFVYADIHTGNLAHLQLRNLSALIDAGPPLAACELPPRITPMREVLRDNAELVVGIASAIAGSALLSWGVSAYLWYQLRALRKQCGKTERLKSEGESSGKGWFRI